MRDTARARTAVPPPRAAPQVPVAALGWSLSTFLVVSYLLCVLLGLVAPAWGLHRPWLQFLPGFTWLTWPSFFLGLTESFAYGWYVALVFGLLFNLFASRLHRRGASGAS